MQLTTLRVSSVLLGVAVAIAASAGTSAAATRVPGYLGCASFFPAQHPKPLVRPGGIVIACADANFSLKRLHWTSWSARGAHATGLASQNDCKPYCAAGHFHSYPATASLSKPKKCKSGAYVFTRLTWRFTRSKPTGMPRQGVEDYAC